MLRTSRFLLIVVSALVLLLAACSNQAETPEPTIVPATSVPVIADGPAVRVGVLSIRSAAATTTQYGPVTTYLSETLGRPVELVPVAFEALFRTIEQGNLDFILANPLSSVQLQRRYNTNFLATISRPITGAFFSGLIITRNDGEITRVDDMRGKKAACVNFETGAGGCQFQMRHLLEQGFDAFEDFSSFVENPSQDNIVLGVLNGTYDVGFIRTGQLERMVADDMIFSMDEVLIIDQAEDDFFFPHTTILYPEWAFAALADTDPELSKTVQTALVEIPSDYPGLAEGGISGFVIAVDYTPMETLIDTLQLKNPDEATPAASD